MVRKTIKASEVKNVLRNMKGNPVSLHIEGRKTLEGTIKYGTNLVGTNSFQERIQNGKLGTKNLKVGYYFVEGSSSIFNRTVLKVPLNNVTSLGKNYSAIEATLLDYTNGSPTEVKGKIESM